MTLADLRSMGFYESKASGRPNVFRVRCSQCEAAVINGVPAHEAGCPNALHECHGCNAMIPVNQRYCADCQ